MGGALFATKVGSVYPQSFSFIVSINILSLIIIGGLGSIYGSFLGAAILTLLPEFLRVFHDFDVIIYGLMLILMTMFMPGGLISGFEVLVSAVRKGKRD